MLKRRVKTPESGRFIEVSYGSESPLRIYFPCGVMKIFGFGRSAFGRSSHSNDPMLSSSNSDFRKSGACPSSQELLDFQNGDIDRERGVDIRIHNSTCEFCAAEVEFYSRFPQMQDESGVEPEEIPEPLFELAEALFKNSPLDTGSYGEPAFIKGRNSRNRF